MIKTCNNCNNEFDAKRVTAEYCSDKCRVQASRVSVTESVKNRVSVTKEVKMAENLSVTKNKSIEIIDKSQLSPRAGDPKVPASFDDKYSPNYDLSEEGFIRRNKNWGDFSERFRENRRRDARQIKEDIALELVMLQRLREGGWNNPLSNTALAPKS